MSAVVVVVVVAVVAVVAGEERSTGSLFQLQGNKYTLYRHSYLDHSRSQHKPRGVRWQFPDRRYEIHYNQ